MNLKILTGILLFIFLAGCSVPASQTGTLRGHISIGPLCPVERNPPDPRCQPTHETYQAHGLKIGISEGIEGGFTEVKTFYGDEQGNYKLELPARGYTIVPSDSGRIGGFPPTPVIIKAGETTTQDIEIDTGIR